MDNLESTTNGTLKNLDAILTIAASSYPLVFSALWMLNIIDLIGQGLQVIITDVDVIVILARAQATVVITDVCTSSLVLISELRAMADRSFARV